MEKIYEIVRIKQETQARPEDRFKARSGAHASVFAKKLIGDDDREVLLVLCLNTRHDVVSVQRVSVGVLNQTLINPREVFKGAILSNSAGIIIAHQHPSGDPQPSPEDIKITKELIEAGDILGIKVVDSLVIGYNEVISVQHGGYL